MIRRAVLSDLEALLELYTHLHGEEAPPLTPRLEQLWRRICENPDHWVLLGFHGEELVGSCAVTVVENLTHGQRPYALVENVVTHPRWRKKGWGARLLAEAKNIAMDRNCYKIMLLTGSKQESTLRFYQRAGYNTHDKTAFVQWL